MEKEGEGLRDGEAQELLSLERAQEQTLGFLKVVRRTSEIETENKRRAPLRAAAAAAGATKVGPLPSPLPPAPAPFYSWAFLGQPLPHP